MKKCLGCGKYFTVYEEKQRFLDWLVQERWHSEDIETIALYFDTNYCFDCNKESIFDKIPSFTACGECDRPFLQQNSEERFGDYLYGEIGYMGTMLEAAQYHHNFDLCSDCNIRHFNSIREEFEDKITTTDPYGEE